MAEGKQHLAMVLKLLCGAITLCVMASNCWANVLGIFPAGPGCKSAALESAVDCADPQTLLYNPAIMAHVEPRFFGEIGIARLDYSYEHPSFDPVRLQTISPMFSEGWKGYAFDESVSWGFAVMPTSANDITINGLPRRVQSEVEPMNITAGRRQFHFPVGGSLLLAQNHVSLGASLIYTYDARKLKGAAVTDPSNELVSMTAKGHFFRPVMGFASIVGSSSLASSFIFPVTKRFSGNTKIASETAAYSTELVEYDPGVLLFSARQELGPLSTSVNFNRVLGSRGQAIPRDGLNRKTNRADLRDSNHLGLRVGYRTDQWGDVSIAGAYVQSYMGDGFFYTDEEGFSHHQLGNLFGQFNAIPVRNFSMAWKRNWGQWQSHASIFRSQGSTTTSSNADNPGHYQLEFVSITCGLRRMI